MKIVPRKSPSVARVKQTFRKNASVLLAKQKGVGAYVAEREESMRMRSPNEAFRREEGGGGTLDGRRVKSENGVLHKGVPVLKERTAPTGSSARERRGGKGKVLPPRKKG